MSESITYLHNLAEDFLCKTLGILCFGVHEHDNQLEHALTPLVLEKLKNFSENTLGEFLSYFMLETAIIGKLANIDPFNQPAVQKVKIDTKKLLV